MRYFQTFSSSEPSLDRFFGTIVLGTTSPKFRCPDRRIANEGVPVMKLSQLAPVALIICAIALAACANTVRGVGRDIKQTAQAVEETAENP
jgi:predicted small secreted protein